MCRHHDEEMPRIFVREPNATVFSLDHVPSDAKQALLRTVQAFARKHTLSAILGDDEATLVLERVRKLRMDVRADVERRVAVLITAKHVHESPPATDAQPQAG